MDTARTKVFAANDPHILTPIPSDANHGAARFAAAAIATRLFNLGRWNGVDRLVFQADPLAMQALSIDLLVEGDDYTIDDDPADADTQPITVIAPAANGVIPPDPLLGAAPLLTQTSRLGVPRSLKIVRSSSPGWDTDGDYQPTGKAYFNPLPDGLEIESGFQTHSPDPIPDFQPSAAAEQVRTTDAHTLDAMLSELRRQLVDLNEHLADALAINRLQSDMLRELAAPRSTRIEVCTLVQNLDTLRAQADDELALYRNDGWQAVSYGYPQEQDGYHFRIVTLERVVPVEQPQPQPEARASAESLFARVPGLRPVGQPANGVPERRMIERAVPISGAFAHPLEAW